MTVIDLDAARAQRPITGEQLAEEVCDLIERRRPRMLAGDSMHEMLDRLLPALQDALGRPVTTPKGAA